eukprot:TRINITY_DN572_c0_g1_i1.p1 TRINITY_DN572_c0_g1~~TRINITY_DN572_c0_g1_i1.p1  ORF type:complete len:441 (-),score=105.16 TRINITY_DN572_c0_g1_i1:299-1621(-)
MELVKDITDHTPKKTDDSQTSDMNKQSNDDESDVQSLPKLHHEAPIPLHITPDMEANVSTLSMHQENKIEAGQIPPGGFVHIDGVPYVSVPFQMLHAMSHPDGGGQPGTNPQGEYEYVPHFLPSFPMLPVYSVPEGFGEPLLDPNLIQHIHSVLQSGQAAALAQQVGTTSTSTSTSTSNPPSSPNSSSTSTTNTSNNAGSQNALPVLVDFPYVFPQAEWQPMADLYYNSYPNLPPGTHPAMFAPHLAGVQLTPNGEIVMNPPTPKLEVDPEFKVETSLRKRAKRDPNKPKKVGEFKCEFCGKMLASKTALASHTRSHVGDKPYKCTFPGCDKSFAWPSNLSHHKRIHLEDKPYKCTFPNCGKSFSNASNLIQHSRIHSGARPYKCDTCGKSFTNLSNYKQHSRTHTGERPFKCNYFGCPKEFTTQSSLKQHHIRIHKLVS